MDLDVVVQVPVKLILKAAKTIVEVKCHRKQPIFELDVDRNWRVRFVCGTGKGKYRNGFGAGHVCSEECPMLAPMEELI